MTTNSRSSNHPTLLKPEADAESTKSTKHNRSCWTFWSSPDVSYLPVSSGESKGWFGSSGSGAAPLKIRHNKAGEVLHGLAHASVDRPLWHSIVSVVPIEALLYVCLCTFLDANSTMVWLLFAVWLNVHFLLHNMLFGGCMGPFSRHRARVIVGVFTLLPLAWQMPWVMHRMFECCKIEGSDHWLGENLQRQYKMVCPGTLAFSVGTVISNPAPVLAALMQAGVPLAFLLCFFGSGSQLTRLKARGNLCKTQVLALDVFDIGALCAQMMCPDIFMYLQGNPALSDGVILLLPVSMVVVLLLTASAFRVLDTTKLPGVEGGHPAHRLHATEGGRALLSAVTVDIPFLLLRLIFAQQASALQGVYILKNVVSGANKLCIFLTCNQNNLVSAALTRLAGILPGHDAYEHITSADISADSKLDLQEKVADLTKLIDDQTLAAKTLCFQRALLGAQGNILIGVTDLDALALKEGFEAFDTDHDGRLSHTEVNLMMRSVANIVDPLEVERFIRECDTNRDGMIDYEEFAARIVRDNRFRSHVLQHRPDSTKWWKFWARSMSIPFSQSAAP